MTSCNFKCKTRLESNQDIDDASPSKISKPNDLEFKISQHCLFCGKDCLAIDSKNPKKQKKCFHFKENKKQFLMDICIKREDKLAVVINRYLFSRENIVLNIFLS